MSDRRPDFAKRFDDYIDETPDYLRETARLFYEMGLEDAEAKCAFIFIPVPIENKKNTPKKLERADTLKEGKLYESFRQGDGMRPRS